MPLWSTLRDSVLQATLGSVDWLYRTAMGRRQLPPWSLRFYVGCAGDFEGSGAEYLAYLKVLAGLRSSERVLDIGCGCGMIALQLTDFLRPPGSYVGLDISARAIAWCRRHIGVKHPNFNFVHADIRNTRYNPQGTLGAETYRFPYADSTFDLILLKSVFTHLMPKESDHYMREIARLLADDGGRCLGTFFLLNPAQVELAAAGRNRIEFRYAGDAGYGFADRSTPERAVAIREDVLRRTADSAGLHIDAVHHGGWSGRPDGLSYQDIVIFRRK